MKRTYTLALVCALWLGTVETARAADVAEWLPANTTAYARLANLSKLYGAMEKSGFRDWLHEQAQQGGPRIAREFLAWEKVIKSIKSVHFSLHGLRPVRYTVYAEALMIADIGKTVDAKAWLPPMVGAMLKECAQAGPVKVYQAPLREFNKCGLFLAGAGGRVFVSTDLLLLENTLEAMAKGRKAPLAREPRYRRATRDQEHWDCLLYAGGPELMGMIAAVAGPYGSRELHAVAEMLSLRDIRAAAALADYSGHSAKIRVRMDSESLAYKLLARPGTGPKMPAHLAADTFFFASLNLGDGKKTWPLLCRYLSRKLLRIGEVKSLERFHQEMKQGEKELNFTFDSLASVVQGDIGVALEKNPDREGFCVFWTTNNEAEGRKLVERFAASREFRRTEKKSHECQGIRVQVLERNERSRLAWAILDNVVLMSEQPGPVESCIKARKQGKTLRGADGYRRMPLMLPEKAMGWLYWNPEAMLRAIGEYHEAPEAAKSWVKGMAVGGALLVADGEIELRLAQTKPDILVKFFEAIRAALAGEMFGFMM